MRGIACAKNNAWPEAWRNVRWRPFIMFPTTMTTIHNTPGRSIRSLSSHSSTSEPSSSSSPSSSALAFSELSTASGPSGAFLGNDEVAQLASLPLHPVTLKDLIRFGRPPLSKQALLASARFTREVLPIRLARRIVSLRNLPFVVVSNEHISKIYNNYQDSLRSILLFPPDHPDSLAEEERFTQLLSEIVKIHSNTIPTLAKGFIECRKYISSNEVAQFLDRHLRSRIGTRLLTEQHIALHTASTEDSQNKSVDGKDGEEVLQTNSYIGTIDTSLQPSRVITSCADFVNDICEWQYGARPKLLIDGHTDLTFPYIPVHLEYIITELLKNAFRATQENRIDTKNFEPVICTIAGSKDRSTVSIRIRDRGGGINPDILEDIWKYSFTTYDRQMRGYYGPSSGVFGEGRSEGTMGNTTIDALNIVSGAGGDVSSIAGLGYGLPLSRAYAEYFGGSLELQSCYGWGTDVYLTLRSIDTNI